MAVVEITESEYSNIRKDLSEGIALNTVASKYGWGNRRIALIQRSKSYKSYLALRSVERRKRAQNTPAVAKPGKHELSQPNQDFMVPAADTGESVPADEAKPTNAGEVPTPAAKSASEERRLKVMELEGRKRREARERRQKLYTRIATVLAVLTFVLAVVGLVALVRAILN